MAPVCPLHFVARQASAWIMTLYFGDVVRHFCRWRDLRCQTYSASVTQLSFPQIRPPYTSYKRCRSKKNHNNPGVRAQLLCVACTQERSQRERAGQRSHSPSLEDSRPLWPTAEICSIARATELYSSRRYRF